MKNLFKKLKSILTYRKRSGSENRYLSAGFSDKGNVRKNNQDSILINQELGVYILADGMGGKFGGEVASRIAVTESEQFLESLDWCNKTIENEQQIISAVFKHADEKIRLQTKKAPEYTGMGTTMVLLTIKNNIAYIGHIGDSRIYLIRDGEISLLTQDHSLINEIKKGTDSPKKLGNLASYKHILTRAVGTGVQFSPDFRHENIERNDIFVLTSDGLTNFIDDELIKSTLLDGDSNMQEASRKLIDMANSEGGTDNISCILVKVIS